MAGDATAALEYLAPPPSSETALATLAEPVRAWFRARFGAPPRDVRQQALGES